MSQTALVGGRSPEARSGNELAATAAKQVERAKHVAAIARSAGIKSAVKFAYGRLTGTEIQGDIVLKARELRFPVTMRANPSDISNFHEIIGDRVYGVPQGLRERINDLPIVDMGAYIGISAAYFASRHPGSPVLAVEPHDRNFRMLSANAVAYGGQIDVRQAAFVAQTGGVGRTMLDAPDSHMANLYSSDGTEGGDPHVSTAAMTPGMVLEEIDGEEIGLLKVDIEGGERDVFGSPEIDELLAQTQLLMVETHDRFVPGSSQAVEEATMRTGMQPMELNPHTTVYTRV